MFKFLKKSKKSWNVKYSIISLILLFSLLFVSYFFVSNFFIEREKINQRLDSSPEATWTASGATQIKIAVKDGKVILLNHHGQKIQALVEKTGVVLWVNEKKKDYKGYAEDFFISENKVFVSYPSANEVLVLDVDSGEEIVTYSLPKLHGDVFVYNDLLFYNDNHYNEETDSYLHAFDLKTGKEKWAFQVPKPTGGLSFNNGLVFFGSLQALFAVRIESGIEEWSYSTRGNIYQAPILFKDSIIVESTDGRLISFSQKNGVVKWEFQGVDSRYSNQDIYLIANIVYHYDNDDTLRAVNATNGEVIWKKSIDGKLLSVDLDKVIVGRSIIDKFTFMHVHGYKLTYLNPSNGEIIKEIEIWGNRDFKPFSDIISGKHLFLTYPYYGTVYAYDIDLL